MTSICCSAATIKLPDGSTSRIPPGWEGSFLDATGNGSYGSFRVADSSFQGTRGFYIWYPTSDSAFVRNEFNGTSGLSAGTRDGSLRVEGNSFVGVGGGYSGDAAIVNWAAYGDPLVVINNTFSIPDGRFAIELPVGYTSTSVDASSNYWGTTNLAVIRGLILDRQDDLNRASVVVISNPLPTPHPSAPEVPLVVRGTAGNDTLDGGGLNDQLFGRAGNDLIDGAHGRDIMSGGAGDDIFVVDDAGDQVVESISAGTDHVRAFVTYTLAQNVEGLSLQGSASLDGTRNSLNNHLTGNTGDNRLDGGVGADIMEGLAGSDTYTVDDVGDTVVETLSAGTDEVRSQVSYRLSDYVENLTLVGNGAADGTGNSLNNLILGTSDANHIHGLDGDDTLNAGDGNDIISGGSDNDIFIGGGGIDTADFAGDASALVYLRLSGPQNTWQGRDSFTGIENLGGSNSFDRFFGDDAANILDGRSGDDKLYGGGNSDTLIGGQGNDFFHGGADADTIIFAGDQAVIVDIVATTAVGQGTDTLGGVENITGSNGNDEIRGNAWANVLNGAGGNDVIVGRGGSDTLTGGAGSDRFVFANFEGNDRIIDFQDGVDRIQIGGPTTGINDLTIVNWGTSGSVVSWGAGTTIAVMGVSAAQLTASDFILV